MSKIEEAMKLIGPGCACEVNLGNILVLTGALAEAIEQHEAYRQEVSDAVGLSIERCGHDGLRAGHINEYLGRFIITKPDPLVEVCREIGLAPYRPEEIRAALAKRGLEIREKSE